jgi:hypothetical protein
VGFRQLETATIGFGRKLTGNVAVLQQCLTDGIYEQLRHYRVRGPHRLLPNEKLLVAGGESGIALTSAEMYDPVANTWTTVASMNTPRFRHTAVLLPDGRVLVAGGYSSSGSSLVEAEIYDPQADIWMAVASLNSARYIHTATLLPDGRVLAAGGYTDGFLNSAELYETNFGSRLYLPLIRRQGMIPAKS